MDKKEEKKENVKRKIKEDTKSNKWLLCMVFLILILIGAIFFGLYKVKDISFISSGEIHNQQAQVLNNQLEIQKLAMKLDSISEGIRKNYNEDKQRRSAINTMLGDYQGQIDIVKQKLDNVKKTYLLPQQQLQEQIDLVNKSAAILDLNLAVTYIKLTSNYSGAIILINKAINSLTLLGVKSDKSLYQLRSTLSILERQNESLNLKNKFIFLEKLIEETKKLTILNPGVTNLKQENHSNNKTFIRDSWEHFKSLIVIEDYNHVNQVLLNQESRDKTRYLVSLYLLQAQSAMLQNYNDLSNQKIKDARGLVNKFFEKDKYAKEWLALSGQVYIKPNNQSLISLKKAIDMTKSIKLSAELKRNQERIK